ncbi:MAG: thiol:disulfide interchange protein DsbA/DsbL [Rhodocyclaceae bacterium]|nr:thiol:disulfide interchange protein DsbA/DsbL [Rhodocyclaceae bacterium]
MSLIQKLTRRSFLVLSLAGLAAFGAQAAAPVAGKDYQVLNPAQPTSGAGKIEVMEFFSYGCPHCKDLEPLLENWSKKLPKDVAVKRVPVAFGASWVPLQKMYLTLEALGQSERLNAQVFAAVHNENLRLNDEKIQLDWVAAHGVDRKKYQEMYNSFTVQSSAMRAQQLTRDYKIEGVPSLAVAGRYLTSASLAGNHENSLAVVDELIAKSRPGQGKK